MLNPRYLQKLPPKSFSVAPGDVIGGLIYVMDKPLGIEEGMVGISVDSEPYRLFITGYLKILEELRNGANIADYDNNKYPHLEALSKRYKQFHEEHKSFNEKSEKEKIDLLLEDKIHVKKRHSASWKEFKQVFTSFSKYHDMKGLQSYYVNKGMGGLLFNAYKDKCGIKKKEHFATKIGKLITKDGEVVDKAYMVKQDGQMALGGTGPGWNKMLKTNTGKSLQKLINPWVILCTGGLSALAFGLGMLGWRAFYLSKNKPAVSNSDAIIEALSTKMASKRGIASQEIDTIEGTYENGIPKVATVVTWASGCRDLSGKLTGSNDWSSVIVQWDKNDRPVKVDNKGNIIRTNAKDEKGNITSYEKVLKDGTIVKATAQEYHNAKAVSDDRIAGLGESLISFISMGDRDGIGKAGQNKAIMPLVPSDGNKSYQFFGIDFGKSYKQANPIIHTLKDDFSFDNPTSRQSRFVNYSIMYDNPLREKMKGVYLLAALRDQLTPEMKEKIAKEYESGNDKAFAEKLRGYPASVGGINSDIKVIQDEIIKYEQLANEVNKTDAQKEQYRSYANRLKEMKKIAIDTDKVVLDTFSKRVNLTPKQIDLLDNIEKLSAKSAHTTSHDGTVLLNHLRVERTDRCAWQLKVNENGTYELQCEETQKLNDIKKRLQALDNPLVQEIFNKMKTEGGKWVIKDLTTDEINILQQNITEKNVAKARDLPYRSEEMRNQFHERLKLAQDNKEPMKVEKVVEQPVLEQRVKHMGAQFRHSAPNISANTNTVLNQRKATLEDMINFLNKDENKLKHHIVHMQNIQMGSFKQFQGLAITFKHPDKNIEAKMFVEQTKDEGLRFSFPKNLNQSDFDFSAFEMAKLAVSLAGIGEEFHLSYASDAQKDMLEKAMKNEIDMAIVEQRFDQITQPQMGSDKPSQRMSL
ncbi:MAG: hypothetical protein HYX61_08340 [Gammaproteobacteria bacterium]|jgi:hypothetical protein|nr:hypothetical protein [Gammaproteobacteria bacterium]